MTDTPSTAPHDPNPQAPQSPPRPEGRARQGVREATAFWYDRQHKELLFYLSVAIFFLELVVGAVAFFYGVIHAEPGLNGGPPRFQFPWLAYALAAVLVPAGLLLIVHLAGVGLFRSLRGQEGDEAWRKDLPERLRKVYAIIQGAPTVVLLLGILLLGVAVFYFDGALTALMRLGRAAEQYLPWIIGSVAAVWCVGYVARVWLNYRTRKMAAEYEFRREVLERTGIIIVDRGSVQLPPAMAEPDAARALEGPTAIRTVNDMGLLGGAGGALPPGDAPHGESPDGPVLDVTPPRSDGDPKAS